MRYSEEQFFALMDEIEFQGGEHCQHSHAPDSFRLKLHPDGPEKVRETTGCNNPTLFDVSYALPSTAAVAKMGKARVCAVCDNIGQWPRFAHALEGTE